jgi:hypothetical protein
MHSLGSDWHATAAKTQQQGAVGLVAWHKWHKSQPCRPHKLQMYTMKAVNASATENDCVNGAV